MERNNPIIIDEATALLAAYVIIALTAKECVVIKNGENSHELLISNVDQKEFEEIFNKRLLLMRAQYIEEDSIVYASIRDPTCIQLLANLQVSPPKFKSPSKSVSNHKHAQLFSTVKKLMPAEASGLMSHETYIVRKNSAFGSDKDAQKFKNDWYKKKVASLELAERETAVQEIFRLIISDHPKTRVLIEEPNEIFVCSKGIQGFQSLEKMNPGELHDKLLSGEIFGLGETMPVALWAMEIDFKRANLCINNYNKVIKFDGDWCFPTLRSQKDFANHNFTITEKTLDELPFCSNYDAYNWMDVRIKNMINIGASSISLKISMSQNFRYEVNKSTLKSILLPYSLIKKLVNHYVTDTHHATSLINLFEERKQMLYAAAVKNKSFQEFILHDESIHYLLKSFCEHLHRFKLTGKIQLIESFIKKTNENLVINEEITNSFYGLRLDIQAIRPISLNSSSNSSPKKNTFLPLSGTPMPSPKIKGESSENDDWFNKDDDFNPKLR